MGGLILGGAVVGALIWLWTNPPPERTASNEDARQIVKRIDPEIDRIEGLITLRADSGRIWGLVESRAYLAGVREELARLQVPASLLELHVTDGLLIPYPNDDPRLMRWINRQ